MKIRALAAICKKNKNVEVYNYTDGDGELIQYVSDYGAIYPLYGLPWMEKENILTMFDVPEKDREKWLVLSDSPLPYGINFSDYDRSDEIEVKTCPISINYYDRELLPVITTKGIVYIDTAYFKPIMDAMGHVTLHQREDKGGNIYIVAKVGILLQAIIFPYCNISEELVCALDTLHKETKKMIERTMTKEEDHENHV